MNPINKQDAKVALITGGARRIGASIVKGLHEAGFRVVIHCHQSLKEAHELAQGLNQKRMGTAFVLQVDLNKPYAAEEIINRVKDWAGRLDVLVNNASIFVRSQEIISHPNQWDVLFNTNVKAPFFLSLAAKDLLAKVQGVIVNISDIHAQRPLKAYAAYCQSKAALDMQTKALAKDLAPDIRVNAVAPGAIVWPEQGNQLRLEEQEKIIAKTPLKRHGDPKFITQSVLFLVENPFVTGQIVRVDGGRSL